MTQIQNGRRPLLRDTVNATTDIQTDIFTPKQRNDQRLSQLLKQEDIQPFFTDLSDLNINVTCEDRSKIEAIENVDWDDLEDVSHLADGGMCRVYNCKFNGIECVAKSPLPDVNDPTERADIDRSLQDEVAVLRKVKHPNIIAYYGSGTRSNGDFFILLEKLEGILIDVLGSKDDGKQGMKFKDLDAVRWGLELAQAMSYLHDKAVENGMILHRDLKPENVGFGADGQLKVIDLGLAIIVDRSFRSRSDNYQMSGGVGSLRYMAPEIALSKPYNEKADVHSFAMILWEMLSRVPPYNHLGFDDFMTQAVQRGQRPPCNRKWSEEIKNVLKQAWAIDQDERPAFREIVGHMEGIMMDEINKAVNYVKPPSTLDRLKAFFGCGSSAALNAADPRKLSMESFEEEDGEGPSSPKSPHFNLSSIDDKIKERERAASADNNDPVTSEEVTIKIDTVN